MLFKSRSSLWRRITKCVCYCLCLTNSSSLQSQDTTVEVVIEVTVPSTTPKDAKLYLAGNHAALGKWKPDGLELKRTGEQTFEARFSVPAGELIQFKVTRGSWPLVEKDSRNREIVNREFVVSKDSDKQIVKIEVQTWGDGKPTKPTVSGDLRTHEKFHSAILDNDRTIQVWLPKDYETSMDRYAVLYMHDGQNLFDESTAAFGFEWQVDETAASLLEQQKIMPLIVVGVWNTPKRMSEYTFHQDEKYKTGGEGEKYLQFLQTELKPFIDKTYRTRTDRESTGICGSSLGGLISLHALLARSEMFSRFGVVSPALLWSEEVALADAESMEWRTGDRVWLSMGEHEGGDESSRQANVRRANRLRDIFIERGLKPHSDFEFLEVPQAKHNEQAWSEIFPQILQYLFPKE